MNVALRKQLWVVGTRDPETQAVQHLARQWAEAHQVTFSPVLARVVQDPTSRLMRIIGPDDAQGLYTGAHRALTAVFTVGTVRVPLDPTAGRITRRTALPMAAYMANKAFIRVISRPEETAEALNAVAAWMAAVHCSGHDDPRCLPRMLFPSSVEMDLSQDRQRDEFIRQHRGKGSVAWRDGEERDWEYGPHHTRDALHVGGHCLPLGMHWDVTSGRRFEMANGWEKRVVPRSGYLNVHPDGHLRGNQATRVPRETKRRRKR